MPYFDVEESKPINRMHPAINDILVILWQDHEQLLVERNIAQSEARKLISLILRGCRKTIYLCPGNAYERTGFIVEYVLNILQEIEMPFAY